jgi:hypothetical protein
MSRQFGEAIAPTENPDIVSWHRLTSLVGLVSLTGRIADTRPLSMLLIGRAGSGKTALLERYRIKPPGNRHMLFGTTASSWGLANILKSQVPAGVTTIVASEFQTWMYRKGAVWDALLGLLLPATEEGVWDIYNGPDKMSYHGARIGLIAAMTDDAFNHNRIELERTGLLSRMLVVKWQRDADDVLASRKRFNNGDTSALQKVHIDLPPGRVSVAISPRLADVVTDYSHAGNAEQTQRGTNRLIGLVKAHAWVQGSPVVTPAHWESFRETFAAFFSWEG